jgi:hypothetical protein
MTNNVTRVESGSSATPGPDPAADRGAGSGAGRHIRCRAVREAVLAAGTLPA